MGQKVIKLNEQDIEILVKKILKEEDDWSWADKIDTSEGGVRDIYNDPELQPKAWLFAEMNFPEEVMEGLLGETIDGTPVTEQGIDNMLNMVNDLGDFTREEWKFFFERIREEGI